MLRRNSFIAGLVVTQWRNNMKRILALSFLLAGLPFAANAGEAYFGAGVGQFSVKSATFLQDFCTTDCASFDESDTGFSVYFGYQITDAVAIELDYVDGGTLDEKDLCTPTEPCTLRVEPRMTSLVGVGSVPLTDNLHLFGKAGVAFTKIDESFNVGAGFVSAESASTQDLTLGTGLEYRFGNWRIRGEGQWIDIEDTDKALVLMISAAYGFGGSN
jgi:OOP family OmpA-OmpF porin